MRLTDAEKMHDADVRTATWTMINRRKINNGPDVLKLNEFGLCGEVRADIVVVNGHMSGYELKSATDDLKRLPRQIIYYSKILDYCNLVVAETHFQDAIKIVPDFWGVYIVKMNRKGVAFIRKYRSATFNQGHLDPYSIAQLLWRSEILQILDEYGFPREKTYQTRFDLWTKMANSFTLTQLRRITRLTLKKRINWR